MAGLNGSYPASYQVLPVLLVPPFIEAVVAVVSGIGWGAPASTTMS